MLPCQATTSDGYSRAACGGASLRGPDQTNNFRFGLALKSEDRIHASSRVGAAVDVVAKKHDCVAWAALTSNLIEDVVQSGKIAVDVPYRNRGHAD